MKKLLTYTILSLGLLPFFPKEIHAQDEFESVEVLDHPRFNLNRRFVLDAEMTFLPLDAFYKPLLLDAALSYQFLDWFNWEIVRGSFPIYTHDTGLNNQIKAAIEAETSQPYDVNTSEDIKEMKYKVGTAGIFNLLYSKSNFFNQAVVYHYWQAGIGFSFWDLDIEKQQTVDLILRARFFLNEHFMLNLRMAHSIGFNSDAPVNIIQLGGGAGFAF